MVSCMYLKGNKMFSDFDKLIINALSERYKSLNTKTRITAVPLSSEVPTTIAARGKANVRALEIVSQNDTLTPKQISEVKKYTGFGGISGKNFTKYANQIGQKVNIPLYQPDPNAARWEYYTPLNITYGTYNLLRPLRKHMHKHNGKVLSLEPSAGIGRFIEPFSGAASMDWYAVDKSFLAYNILKRIYPNVRSFNTSFEEFVTSDTGSALEGKFGLVIGNPPYGKRGALAIKDPAYAGYGDLSDYQVVRGMSMLAPESIGVFLVTKGLLSSTDNKKVRETLLKENHLLGAFRLPSLNKDDKPAIFEGTQIVVDLIFFQKRKATLKKTLKEDSYILNGGYFKQHPTHILGREIQRKKDASRFDGGYAVKIETSTFQGLPEKMDYRPMAVVSSTKTVKPKKTTRTRIRAKVQAEKIGAELIGANAQAAGIWKDYLDLRISDPQLALNMHPLVKETLISLRSNNENFNEVLSEIQKESPDLAATLSTAYNKDGSLSTLAKQKPTIKFDTSQINPLDIVQLTDALYKHSQKIGKESLSSKDIGDAYRKINGKMLSESIVDTLLESGVWCLDGKCWHPHDRYYAGELWPKYDRLEKVLSQRDKFLLTNEAYGMLQAQKNTLLQKISPLPFGEILEQDKIGFELDWIPIDVLRQWFDSYYTDSADASRFMDNGDVYANAVIPNPTLVRQKDNSLSIEITLREYKNNYSRLFFTTLRFLRETAVIVAERLQKIIIKRKAILDIPTFKELGFLDSDSPAMEAFLSGVKSSIEGKNIAQVEPKLLCDVLSLINQESGGTNILPETPVFNNFQKIILSKYNRLRSEKTKKEYQSTLSNTYTVFQMLCNLCASFRFFPSTKNNKMPFIPSLTKNPMDMSRYIANIPVTPPLSFLSKKVTLSPLDLSRKGIIWNPQRTLFGYLTNNRALFRPSFTSVGMVTGENTKLFKAEKDDVARMRLIKQYKASWGLFLLDQTIYQEKLQDLYNRKFRGYIEPKYGGGSLNIYGWDNKIELRPYQNVGVKKLLNDKTGLLAFDVGLGKTFSGIAVIAKAKQEGWGKRPVVVVPKTLAINWKKSILECLPNYRIGIIGIEKGSNKAEKRGKKWIAFKQGLFDVIILTYPALAGTALYEETYERYGDKVLSMTTIPDKLAKARNSKKSQSKALNQKDAVLGKTIELLLPKRPSFDIGIQWEDIGVDFLMVDEAQNFKNLFFPQPDFSETPKFLGIGKSSKRAMNLDIRCEEVRRIGGSVFLLSATPAKNSPIEFYNLLNYCAPQAWKNMGITSPDDFMERFLSIQLMNVMGTSLQIKLDTPAVVAFKMLDEFRQVLGRYALFETVDTIKRFFKQYPDLERKLKIPKAFPAQIFVNLTPLQEAEYTQILDATNTETVQDTIYWPLLRGRESTINIEDDDLAMGMLESLGRQSLVAIHPVLNKIDVSEDDPDADREDKKKSKIISKATLLKIVEDLKKGKITRKIDGKNYTIPLSSPKLDACYKAVKTRACGHIIFVENVLVHYIIRQLFSDLGIPIDTIAIMNAKEAPDSEDRQQMSDDFNGDESNGIDPKYNILIANSVAYEGINLQRRTCMIHHLDLGWEPATIQQRNGRGVRQGNSFDSVTINYYLANKSSDIYRYDTIESKRNWLVSAIESQDRETNNLSGQSGISHEEFLLMTARDPAELKERLAIAKEAAEKERLRKVRIEAAQTARTIANLYRQVQRRAAQGMDTASLIQTADSKLESFKSQYSVQVWPFIEAIDLIKTNTVYAPAEHRVAGIIFIEDMVYSLNLPIEGEMRHVYYHIEHVSSDGSTIRIRVIRPEDSLDRVSGKYPVVDNRLVEEPQIGDSYHELMPDDDPMWLAPHKTLFPRLYWTDTAVAKDLTAESSDIIAYLGENPISADGTPSTDRLFSGKVEEQLIYTDRHVKFNQKQDIKIFVDLLKNSSFDSLSGYDTYSGFISDIKIPILRGTKYPSVYQGSLKLFFTTYRFKELQAITSWSDPANFFSFKAVQNSPSFYRYLKASRMFNLCVLQLLSTQEDTWIPLYDNFRKVIVLVRNSSDRGRGASVYLRNAFDRSSIGIPFYNAATHSTKRVIKNPTPYVPQLPEKQLYKSSLERKVEDGKPLYLYDNKSYYTSANKSKYRMYYHRDLIAFDFTTFDMTPKGYFEFLEMVKNGKVRFSINNRRYNMESQKEMVVDNYRKAHPNTKIRKKTANLYPLIADIEVKAYGSSPTSTLSERGALPLDPYEKSVMTVLRKAVNNYWGERLPPENILFPDKSTRKENPRKKIRSKRNKKSRSKSTILIKKKFKLGF